MDAEESGSDPKETGYYARLAVLNRLGDLIVDVTLLRYQFGLRMSQVNPEASGHTVSAYRLQNLLRVYLRTEVCTHFA